MASPAPERQKKILLGRSFLSFELSELYIFMVHGILSQGQFPEILQFLALTVRQGPEEIDMQGVGVPILVVLTTEDQDFLPTESGGVILDSRASFRCQVV